MVCFPMWTFGTHTGFLHDGNKGVTMMSQAPRYPWIDVTNYWGIIIFTRFYNMFSDYDDIFINRENIKLLWAAYNVLKIICNLPRFLKIFEK